MVFQKSNSVIESTVYEEYISNPKVPIHTTKNSLLASVHVAAFLKQPPASF